MIYMLSLDISTILFIDGLPFCNLMVDHVSSLVFLDMISAWLSCTLTSSLIWYNKLCFGFSAKKIAVSSFQLRNDRLISVSILWNQTATAWTAHNTALVIDVYLLWAIHTVVVWFYNNADASAAH